MKYLKRLQYLGELLLCVIVTPFILLIGGVYTILSGSIDGTGSLFSDYINSIFK